MKRYSLLFTFYFLLLTFLLGCGLTSKDTKPAQGESVKLKVYAASGEGLAFSDNSGASWEHFTKTKKNGLLDDHLNSLYIIDNNTFWIGTHKGLSLTTDNAKTWATYTVNNGLGGNEIKDILFYDKTIYAGTNGGLSISTDNARTWHNLSTKDGLSSNLINFIMIHNEKIYLGTDQGLCVSTDNAKSWAAYTVTGNNINNIFIKDEKIYLSTNKGLYITNTANIDTFEKLEVEGFEDLLNGTINTFLIDHEGTWWLGTNKGLARSNNQGQGWRIFEASDGVAAYTINDIKINGLMVFAATNKGLAVSNDGGEAWVTYNKDEGLKSLTLKRIVVR